MPPDVPQGRVLPILRPGVKFSCPPVQNLNEPPGRATSRGPTIWFLSRGWVIFSCKILKTSFAVAISFFTKFTDFSDNIDLQEFFGPFRLFGLGVCNGWPRKATLDLDPEFFSGLRTPALNDYVSRRPSYLLESIERLHQSSFISYTYTGRESHYTQRKLGPKAPEWLRKSHGKSKP